MTTTLMDRVEHLNNVIERVHEGLGTPLLDPAKHQARLQREGKIRDLMRERRTLQAQINNVNDRIALLEEQP